MKVKEFYITKGGWLAMVCSEGKNENSAFLVLHLADFSHKSKEWKDWFTKYTKSLALWHKSDSSLREHCGPLSTKEDKSGLFDMKRKANIFDLWIRRKEAQELWTDYKLHHMPIKIADAKPFKR